MSKEIKVSYSPTDLKGGGDCVEHEEVPSPVCRNTQRNCMSFLIPRKTSNLKAKALTIWD